MTPRPARVALTLLATAWTAGCGAPDASSGDGPLELKLGHVGAPGSLYDVVSAEFARRVADRTDGRVTVHVFGSSQLGGDEVMLQKLKLGTLDLALPSTVMSSTVEAFGLFEMPYLVRDREHMRRIEEAVVWPDLVPRAEEQGYRVLAVWENGFRHVTNNERPVRTPADLRGLKLRTPRGVWRVRLFQAFGANPTPMAFSEVFIALQTGVMDGQENPFAQIHAAKLHEVQEYLSLTGHVYTPAYVTAGVRRWESLPEELRADVEAVAREMQPFVYETAARMEDELLALLREEGMRVNEVDRAAFRLASGALYEEFGERVRGGEGLIRRAVGLAEPADADTVAPAAADSAGGGAPPDPAAGPGAAARSAATGSRPR